jgi:2-methylcitrate dehydratase PrpD
VNGTAAHALDFDNATNTMFGHVSATVIPALLAAAEAYGGSGRDVLLAHVVGFEVGARLGRAVNMHHYEKGWHPTSTLGAMAVAASCARLLNLDAEQTAMALAMSTSLASGIKANFGSMTKPLHVGHCAHDGLLAALLARKGFTANLQAFEQKQGFFNVYDGAEHVDTSRIFENWAVPLDIVAPGACYKQYPCCASTHAPVDAALALVREHGRFAPDAIERVESWTSPRRLIHTDRPEPATALDAKFSIQYCLARALVTGSVLFEHFEGDAHREAPVRAVTSRVRARTYAPGEFESGNDVGAKVMVTLKDGRVLSTRIERPVGRRSDNPIAHDALQAKFVSCARRVLSDAATAAVLEKIEAFETLSSVKELTDILERGVRSTDPDVNSDLARI